MFAIAHALGLPVRFVGVGEGIDDLRDFVAEDFVTALLDA
jgi:fused signal recognition particle receptor